MCNVDSDLTTEARSFAIVDTVVPSLKTVCRRSLVEKGCDLRYQPAALRAEPKVHPRWFVQEVKPVG
jgi:hypothetical protein